MTCRSLSAVLLALSITGCTLAGKNIYIMDDAGYTHIFVNDASINERFNVTPNGAVTGTLRGNYDEGIDIFGIQVNIHI